MGRKTSKDQPTDQRLPRLGVEPYLQLMGRTAAPETDAKSAHMGLVMLWLSDHILDVMDEELASYGITESKLDLLLLLILHQDKGMITPSAIAARLGIRRASATALLDWLEKRQWIAREQSDQDRRMIHVSITPEGKELVERLLPAFWRTCASLVEVLEPEERAVFEKVLLKLNDTIEKRLDAGR
ncbi:MarR family transcriptional regulator [Paenibacillus doosanensis]|uniref:Transcriptional repressor MprA n=1 Tax=Paenibacillus konkukensis TaxID=2020716 RepID=A0ABY4S126_9BACL|nr:MULTISPECIES: MarR family transcriptional regulator [Paenibacillus]MCS7464894.1 MarR family transcriptional regulator [Paenibacillus doosanensis]UQZ87545.1 Transcriptional repressor MprA [Paenibacillus konkukensis]